MIQSKSKGLRIRGTDSVNPREKAEDGMRCLASSREAGKTGVNSFFLPPSHSIHALSGWDDGLTAGSAGGEVGIFPTESAD